MRGRAVLLALLLAGSGLAAPGFAAAQQPASAPPPATVASPPTDCRQAQTQIEMDYCAGLDFKAADARLNAVYLQLMARYDVANQALLRAAEEKWIAWRDSECAYETALTMGGTIHPMIDTMCRTEKTQAHVKELERELACEEGDITCNPPG
ncbi:MAG TPA: lysozyme inhibitor LprI family protein [Rhizomicrobium sp.]|nr:lysozyme inhibitor LprI family protein [Rhizomicrobium sp.]